MLAIIIGLQVCLATVMVILKILPYSFGKVETNLLTGNNSTKKKMLLWTLGENGKVKIIFKKFYLENESHNKHGNRVLIFSK